MLPRFRFENFTIANGLPDNHVYSVLVDGDRIWAGTDNGLAALRERQVEDLHHRDGLAHRAVLSLALDRRTGDVWAGSAAVLEPQRGDLTKPRPTAWVNGAPSDTRALKGRNNPLQSHTYRSS